MDKPNKFGKPAHSAKQSYPELVRRRAVQLYGTIMEVGGGNGEQAVERIYDALKSTALESWKNGLDAGRRRSRSGASSSDNSA